MKQALTIAIIGAALLGSYYLSSSSSNNNLKQVPIFSKENPVLNGFYIETLSDGLSDWEFLGSWDIGGVLPSQVIALELSATNTQSPGNLEGWVQLNPDKRLNFYGGFQSYGIGDVILHEMYRGVNVTYDAGRWRLGGGGYPYRHNIHHLKISGDGSKLTGEITFVGQNPKKIRASRKRPWN